jgi:tetratricopeptide (TPR) repeat protein
MPRAKKNVSYSDILRNCDLDLKAGKIESAVERISNLNLVSVPREFRVRFAVVSRRAGVWHLGLKLLSNVVRSKAGEATAAERVEYAALLSQNGSAREALEILNESEKEGLNETFLFRGFCHVRLWEHEKAFVDFEKFIATCPTPYLNIVARVNAAAVLVALDQYDRALEWINQNIEMARESKSSRLIGNCLELRAQVYLAKMDFDRCRDDLEEAAKMFSPSSPDQLFVFKWSAVMAAVQSGSVQPLEELKQRAQSLQNWNTVREADLYMNKIRFDQFSFDHLYFGSPLKAYRRRILREVDGQPGQTYFWGGEQKHYLDLASGEMAGGGTINAGKNIHRTLGILCRDFYAPLNVGEIFALLHENEYFDIFTSPARIHSTIQRCRDWLERSGVPASIESVAGGYSLRIIGNFAIRISLETEKVDSKNIFLSRLKALGPTFSVQIACRELGMPKSTFQRAIRPLVENGQVEMLNSGRSTKYKIAR